MRRSQRLAGSPRTADAKLEQKLRRSAMWREPDSFQGAGQLGTTMKRTFTDSIVAVIRVIAATSRGGDLARGDPGLVFGAGAPSCGVWLQHVQTVDAYHLVMASWTDGYLIAANERRSEADQTASLGQNSEGTGFDAWVTRCCQANPQAPLFRAASALFFDLSKP
jgi:hypothetical protein